MIAAGTVTSSEVIEAHLARIEEVNADLNAVMATLVDEARRAAVAVDRSVAAGEQVGLLAGVPFTVKENIDVAGSATTWGVAALAGQIAPTDAPTVARLREAGAIPLARTNLPDFAFRWHTESGCAGHTRNPWDASRTPGGSSGGEAVALATGMTPLGLGNDFGGRNPVRDLERGDLPSGKRTSEPRYLSAGGRCDVLRRAPCVRGARSQVVRHRLRREADQRARHEDGSLQGDDPAPAATRGEIPGASRAAGPQRLRPHRSGRARVPDDQRLVAGPQERPPRRPGRRQERGPRARGSRAGGLPRSPIPVTRSRPSRWVVASRCSKRRASCAMRIRRSPPLWTPDSRTMACRRWARSSRPSEALRAEP